jgi:hypothetical protein
MADASNVDPCLAWFCRRTISVGAEPQTKQPNRQQLITAYVATMKITELVIDVSALLRPCDKV